MKNNTVCSFDTRVMACAHFTGPGIGQGTGNDGVLHYTMYCTHYTGTRDSKPLLSSVSTLVLCSVYEPLIYSEKLQRDNLVLVICCHMVFTCFPGSSRTRRKIITEMQYAVGVGAKSTLCELTFLHQHLLHTASSLHGV